MKHFQCMLAVILSLGVCTIARAQENTKQAFEQLIQSKKSAVTRGRFVEQYDVSKMNRPLMSRCVVDVFTIKEKDRILVDNVVNALNKDRDNANCYAIYRHEAGTMAPLYFVFGKNPSDNYIMGENPKSNYTAICVAASDDTTKSHRYVYGIEWERAGKNKEYIVGKLLSGYGELPSISEPFKTTKSAGERTSTLLQGKMLSDSALVDNYDETLWLLKFNKYVDIYVHASRNSMQRIASAIGLWNMCRKTGRQAFDHEMKETILASLTDLIGQTSKNERMCLRYLRMAKDEIEKMPEK